MDDARDFPMPRHSSSSSSGDYSDATRCSNYRARLAIGRLVGPNNVAHGLRTAVSSAI